jgi:uncharacterized protein YndB with AHSA1/START domain
MAVQQLDTDTSRVLMQATVTEADPARVFDYWVQPDLLAKWWPPEAHIEPGGSYRMMWPAMGWTLRGTFMAFERGKKLIFTWKWDHEPDLPERTVTVTFAPLDGITVISVEHGTYTDSEVDQKDRQSHIDGWNHFLEQLQQRING